MEFFIVLMFVVYILLSNRMDKEEARKEDLDNFFEKYKDMFK